MTRALAGHGGLAVGRRFGTFLLLPGFRVDLALVVAAGTFRAACLARFCWLGSYCGLILLLGRHEVHSSFGGSYRSHDIPRSH